MKAEKDSVDKTLKEVEDELQKAQDERKQLELLLSTFTADLESSKAAMTKQKDACTFMKVQLRVAEAEKAELLEGLTNWLQRTKDAKREKDGLEARNNTLAKTVKELECNLCVAQHAGQQKEKEIIEGLSRL
ncbi:M protein, putative [Ixodes scapularis]|uniref:M protein, putative n=1 Tax=Ixodes scapularis TaxID=6945 RepID=B7QM80_IXOSC|nr:M protein, putative [Ixodes scapularis]|eukprot:XP_002416285.1 M protein, putative [Ixodes scapularis]